MSLMQGDTSEATKARQAFLSRVGLSDTKLRLIRPSHSPNLELYDESETQIIRTIYKTPALVQTDLDFYEDGCDGLLTFDPKVTVGLLSADCVPLIVWASATHFHGILHIGLLGALNNMVQSLTSLYEDHSISTTSTYYYLGPSISVDDYNLSGSDFWATIRTNTLSSTPEVQEFIEQRGDKEFFDVHRMIHAQLKSIGVPSQNIQSYNSSTASTTSLFFSNYVDRPHGVRRRFMSAVGYADALSP